MERLTDKKTAADLARNYAGLLKSGQPRDIETERYIKLAAFEDQEERPHGRWIIGEHSYVGRYFKCSECGRSVTDQRYYYCPFCDAIMERVETE